MKLKEGDGKKLAGIVIILCLMAAWAANLITGIVMQSNRKVTGRAAQVEQFIKELDHELSRRK
jgi:hypothetical protein